MFIIDPASLLRGRISLKSGSRALKAFPSSSSVHLDDQILRNIVPTSNREIQNVAGTTSLPRNSK